MNHPSAEPTAGEGSTRAHEYCHTQRRTRLLRAAMRRFLNRNDRRTTSLHRTMKRSAQSEPRLTITAFTSYRTNLSPFTKGCREWDAAM